MGTHKYDEAIVIGEAVRAVVECDSIRDLADTLQIPVSTFRDILKRNGHDFSSLVTLAAQDSGESISLLKEQVKYYQRRADRFEERLAGRRWLRDEIAGLTATAKPVKVPKLPAKKGGLRTQVPILLYSDPHFGLNVPEGQLGVFGSYNSEMARARTIYVFRTFAKLAKQQPFPVSKAKVYLLGDNMEHSHMRPSQAKQIDAHVVEQTKVVSDTLSSCMQFLCGEFDEVEVEAVPGNHGRTTRKAGDNLPNETYDNLCYYIIEKTLKDQPNFTMHNHEAWYFVDEVLGWKFLGLHCEDVLSYVGVPWYGIERAVKDYYMMLGQVSLNNLREMEPTTELAVQQFLSMLKLPDFVTIGHFHNRIAWDVMGVEVLANGALSGASIYSTKRRRRLSRAQQFFFCVHPEHGVGMRCPIDVSKIK